MLNIYCILILYLHIMFDSILTNRKLVDISSVYMKMYHGDVYWI